MKSIEPTAREAAFYRFEVGRLHMTVINDGAFHFPAPAFGTNAPEGAVANLLAKHYLPTDIVTAPIQVMFVETGDHKALIDTGLGSLVFPGDSGNSGKLRPTLDLLGIDPASIDTVLLTHAHPDHLGGISQEEKPAFPNARHLLTQTDYDFWTGTEPNTDDPFFNYMLQAAQTNLGIVESQLECFDGEIEIAPGITTIPAPGHTPGHVAVMLESDDDRLLHLVDVAVQYVVALEQPSWHLAAEVDPVQAEKTRRNLLNRAATDSLKVFASHFPFPGTGHIRYDPANDRFAFLPIG